MTSKILIMSLAIALAATSASAQDTIKKGDVPKSVVEAYTQLTDKAIAKQSIWTKTPTTYTAEYDGKILQFDPAGNKIWAAQKIDKSAIDPDIMQAYDSKYGTDYAFQYAADVTLANGDLRTFIVGRKGKYCYYFKYNDKKLMVEKTATCK
ncbi:MAG: hypothetical protein K6F33_04595 [Bacteroidales bacterium]|nr:hypothetical protein [Bacteroidales bacterium]